MWAYINLISEQEKDNTKVRDDKEWYLDMWRWFIAEDEGAKNYIKNRVFNRLPEEIRKNIKDIKDINKWFEWEIERFISNIMWFQDKAMY